ncbi:uncharacterized protein FSUBG_12892 [Fusarium subglutinans]|uniref:DUF7514 domain-containing protein n=1 Tax=Gibberella subglutinans TaxID=42677 RepID=A0A8H5P2F1_GIBSU|nr:uncharacterized protein FSUBG_12892 [Fusarium subglutinans]KAF5584095.1 hypothetical protein FSUBG_12892 [Fusarium subglutinans]
MDTPPPIPPRPPGYEIPLHQQQQQPQQQYYPPPSQYPPPQQLMYVPRQSPHGYLPNDPRFVQPGLPTPPLPSQPSSWNEHFFYTNGKPTPIFETMMWEFFRRLDPQNTGSITPEAFSSFLDVCQYLPELNIWKRSYEAKWMYAAEDVADAEFLWTLEGFEFDHKKVVRNPANKQMPYGGMPLLTLKGFTDYMAVEFVSDPDDHLGDINAALRYYGVWPEKGPVPRHLLPPTCPPEVTRRVDEACARCRKASADKINAQAAKARIQGMAGRATVALTSNNTYRYY